MPKPRPRPIQKAEVIAAERSETSPGFRWKTNRSRASMAPMKTRKPTQKTGGMVSAMSLEV